MKSSDKNQLKEVQVELKKAITVLNKISKRTQDSFEKLPEEKQGGDSNGSYALITTSLSSGVTNINAAITNIGTAIATK